MGRFTAWMASRRKAQRPTTGASGGRAARSLGFERCEQRLALSTSTGYEPVPIHFQGLDGAEGGFIVLTSGVGTVLTWQAGIVRAFGSGSGAADHWTLLNANDSSNAYSYNSGATQIVASNGLNDYFSPRLASGNVSFQSNSGWTVSLDTFGELDFGAPGLLINESNVVPIPPPASEHGRGEGGQISMIPFIGPSMFGLPTANESQLAVRTRHALGEEQLESTPAAGSPEVNSLRGRAVVYEVAHATPLTPSHEATASDIGEFDETGRHDRAFDGFGTADISRDAVHQRVAMQQVSIERHEGRYSLDASDSEVTEAVFARTPLDDGCPDDRHQADAETNDRSAKPRGAAARDAAFDQLEHELGPLEEQREVAAATADVHQRRIVGGALLAVASVPVLKTMRRKGRRQAVEARPRRPFHAL
jgi:hypothetical protein